MWLIFSEYDFNENFKSIFSVAVDKYITSYLQVYRSHNLVLEADVATDCNITALLAYDWMVKSYDHVAKRDDRKKMVLPPGRLDYGEHSVELKVCLIIKVYD